MRVLAASLMVLALAAGARAHPLMPAALTLRASHAARYDVSFRRPEPLADALAPVFPADCTRHDLQRTQQGDQRVDRYTLRCQRPLEGRPLRVDGLAAVELSAMIYVASASGEEARALLSPAQPSFVIPRRASAWRVLADYVWLGITHLAGGPDHVLFVAGLLLLIHGLRAQLLALTAFTLGHSITLCLAALAIVRLPQTPVEIGIAASLVVLALEIVRAEHQPKPLRRPLLLAGAFGLLHGLGFASALAETGLPPKAVALSLVGFNLGVELGQLTLVLLLVPLLWLSRRALVQPRIPRLMAAYAMGSLAAMWCLERAL